MDDFLEYLSNIFEDFDYKKLIFPTIIILLYISGFVYLLTIIKNNDNKVYASDNISLKEEANNDTIFVDIKGSVKKPGVYELKSNSRVIDAINKAGGLQKDANTRYVNLSKILNDSDVIVIYSNNEIKNAKKDKKINTDTPCVCEEIKNDACINETKSETVNGKININTATIEELKSISGIGESKAKAIVEYRNANGNFNSIEDIKKVSGISESLYAKIKEIITV